MDDTAASLEELARLHATTWQAEHVASQTWLESRLPTYLEFRGIDDIRKNFDGPNGRGVPTGTRDAGRLVEAFRALVRRTAASAEWCVVHGDAHVGNVFVDAAGRPGFVDWQMVQRNPWYLDVGYHIASALSVEERERHEHDLLAHYAERLAPAVSRRPMSTTSGRAIAWASSMGSSCGASRSSWIPRSSRSCCAGSAPPPRRTMPSRSSRPEPALIVDPAAWSRSCS